MEIKKNSDTGMLLEFILHLFLKAYCHYQKFILTLDEDPEADYDDIRRVNALDWLLGKID